MSTPVLRHPSAPTARARELLRAGGYRESDLTDQQVESLRELVAQLARLALAIQQQRGRAA